MTEPLKTIEKQMCPRREIWFRVGDVVKSFNGAYSSATILGFEVWPTFSTLEIPYIEAVLARPMLHAHHLGTAQASPVCGWELYRSNITALMEVEEWRSQRPNNLICSDWVRKETE